MDVRMPDGTVITNVPEGTTKAEVMRRYKGEEASMETQNSNSRLSDRIQGSAIGRYFTGVEDPVVGAVQFGSHLLPGDSHKSVDNFVKKREANLQRYRDAAGSEGFDAARLAGNMTIPMLLGGKYVPKTALGRIAYGAGTGAAVGAATPVLGDNYALEKGTQMGAGGVLGGVIPGAMEATRLGVRTSKHLIEPFFDWGKAAIKGREYLHAAGNKADEIISYLDDHTPRVMRGRLGSEVEPRLNARPGELVPGSKPTAAEAAAPAGRAEFSALQRSVSSHKPSDYLARSHEQQAARRASLGKVAKTPAQLKAAETARSAQAKVDYAATHDYPVALQKADKSSYMKRLMNKEPQGKGTFVDPVLRELESRDSFQAAFKASKKIAGDQGWSWRAHPARLLHTMKTWLDGALDAPPSSPNAINKATEAGYRNVKKELVDWMSANVDGYEVARSNFQQASKPINRMQIGQELQKTLNAPVQDITEVGAQRTGPYATALRDSSKIIKKSGGDPRFNALEDILTPEEMGRVTKIGEDLARRAKFEEQARVGMKSAKGNIVAGQLERETGGSTLPNPLNRTIMIINSLIRRGQGKASEEIQETMAEEMLDPAAVAEVMKRAMIPQKRTKAVMDALNRLQQPAVVGATSATESYVHPH